MRSVDTNVLARYLIDDDQAQTIIAIQIIDEGVFITLSVLLELGWLLESRYRYSRDQIVKLVLALSDIKTISVESEDHLPWLLERYGKGADFGDLIHLIASQHMDRFVTFDKSMAKGAGESTPVTVEILSA